MRQILHATAPAARLMFISANSDEVNAGTSDDESMANAIDSRVTAGADIIGADIMLVTDTACTAGLAATAADREAVAGVVHVVAAGNLGHVGADTIAGVSQARAGYQVASWQTPAFRATSCPAAVIAATAPDVVE